MSYVSILACLMCLCALGSLRSPSLASLAWLASLAAGASRPQHKRVIAFHVMFGFKTVNKSHYHSYRRGRVLQTYNFDGRYLKKKALQKPHHKVQAL